MIWTLAHCIGLNLAGSHGRGSFYEITPYYSTEHCVFATYSDPFKNYFVLLLYCIFSLSLIEMRSPGTVLAKNCQKVVPLFN